MHWQIRKGWTKARKNGTRVEGFKKKRKRKPKSRTNEAMK